MESNLISLKLSELDLLKIYNNIPRTISQTAIVVGIRQNSNNNNNVVSFVEENSGSYWIIKVDNNSGFLLPKGGQNFDKYQYETLESLFTCSGYEQHLKKEFIVNKMAHVSFDINRKEWLLKSQGNLEFGDNSVSSRLKKALEEKERLVFELQQSNYEIRELNNQVEQSQKRANQLQSELEELKNNHTKIIDTFAELQQDKKRQEERNKGVETSLSQERKKSEHLQETINGLIKLITGIPNKLQLETETSQTELNQEIKSLQEQLNSLQSRIFNLNRKQSQNNQDIIIKLTELTQKYSEIIDKFQNQSPQEGVIKSIQPSLLKPQEKKIKQPKTHEPSLPQPMSRIESHSTSLFPTVSDIKQSPTTNLQADFRNKQLVDDIVTKYNNSNPNLFQNVARVTASIDSIEARRSGTTSHIILQETDNNNYCILLHSPLQANYYCLIPKLNLIINNHNYQTIEDIFNCQGYQTRTSGKFLLKKPGLVQKTSTGEWMLIEPGELVFS